MEATPRVARKAEGEGAERVIAMTTLTYTAHFDDETVEISAVAALVEIEDCFLILEWPLDGEDSGDRFVRSASYSPETAQGSWFRHTGGRVSIDELERAA